MLRDVADFDQLAVFPVRVLLWRRSSECGSMHRSPLFDPALGIGLGTMAIDALHTLNVGIYQQLLLLDLPLLLLLDLPLLLLCHSLAME